MQRRSVDITTDGTGAATVYTGDVSGRVVAVRYVPDATTPLDTAADLTIMVSFSGVPILTATDIGTVAREWYPRAAVCTVAGASALYAAGGVAVLDGIPIGDESIKIAVAQGGDTKKGSLHFYVGS